MSSVCQSLLERATIGTIQAKDADIELNGQVTYFFISNGQPLPFRISLTTGEVIVNDTLDRDNPLTQEFYVDVIARDRGLPPLETPIPAVLHVVVLDINDNAPKFGKAEYTASIAEDESVGSSVITLSASDDDKPGTDNSQVRYTFDGGNNGNGSFYIEYSGGTIRVNKSLDRETKSEYQLVVYATDMAPLSQRKSSSVIRTVNFSVLLQVTVKVTVRDVNDNAPQFESDTIVRRIFENQPLRSVVSPVIRATDADLGDYAKITFQLVGGDVNAFELKDLNDGSFQLLSKVLLDYESLKKNYTLQVQASSEHMITKATVIVKLQDINDNRPVLQDFSIIVNNYRGYFPSGYIGRVPAFDPDESDRENLRYAVKTNNEAEYFTLNSTTGYIKLNKDLGSNVNHVVEFVIQVSDLRNTVNATCKLIYRFITADMLTNSVTLRLDDLTPVAFMTHMYKYTVQALAAVLEVKASSVYVIDIKEDTEVNTDIHNPVLNISFAAVQEEDGRDAYLSQGHIKEQIYRRLDLLKNLSAVTALPFDDTLCINEPCINYAKCSVTLEFSEAVPFLISNTLLFRPIRSKKLFSCNCPTGLAGQNTTYSCDTEVNLCYSNPCLNLGTCVQIEGGFRCICPTGYKGERCEYNTMIAVYNASYCPNEVCTGEGAYCVDLIRGGFACHQGAVRCVETDTRTDTCTTRTVSFVSGSYLMFPALQSRIRFNIQLSFATRKKSGLLLYNGRYNHLHDFIALQLIDHKAVLKMSFANQTYSVSVGNKYGLNDGHWHTIEVDYKDATLTISLDQCDVGLNLIHPELFDPPCAQRIEIKECRRLPRGEDQRCALDVTGPLLVGGLPDHFSLDSLRVSSSNLVGCIRDLYINYKHMDFGAAVSKYNTQDGCVYKRDFCITLPCRNKGTCISSWATYQCLCPEERSGRDCSKKIGPSSSFYGIGYLKYATSLDAVGKPWYNSFSFRTTTDYKLIMRVELEQGKTVEYKMERGYITFRYAGFYYVFDEALVNDDRWHHFEMRYLTNSRGQGQILLQLDYGDLQRSEPLDNSLDGLRVQAVWVGGDTSVGRENLGYAGCIKDVSIGSSISLQTLDSPTVRHHVFDGCSKPTTCETPCRAGANSKCEIGWENSTCLCNEGLYGASCSSVCSSKYNPCQHGGKCRVDRETALGYKCVCATGYEGNYCEDKLNTQCAASWWGGPVCVPCSCDVSLNFNSQCNTVTGACTCKTGFFKPSSSDRCVPCDCYYSAGKGGATSLSCDPGTGQCECRSGVTGRMCDRCDNPFAEATADGCVVRYDSCPKSYMDDVWWTRTKFGIVRIETCPSGSVGNATRTCKDNKLGWQQPVLSGCTSLLFLALNESLVELEGRREGNSSEPVVPVTSSRYTFLATHIISSLKNATQQVEKLYRNDLLIALRILRQILLREKVGQAFDLTHTQDLYFMENLVDVTSFVLNPDYTDYWVSIVDTYKSTVLTDLLRDYDEYMANLALNMATKFKSTEMKPFQITTKNMVLAVDTIRSNGVVIPKYNNIKKNDSIFDDVTSAELPPALFSARADGSLVDDRTVSCVILYRTAAELLTSTSDSENDPYTPSVELNDGVYSGPTYGGIILNSPILSLVVQQGSSKPKLLDESIEITFFLRIQEQTLNPQCVYLDDTGKWTSELCQVDTIKDDRVVCSCQHLSTYALITDYNSNLGAVFNHVGVHMYIAVAFSLFCLLLTLAVFVCLRHEKSNYIYIQINALVCFCVSLIIFVSGSDSSANQAACTLVAVLLQFFVLSLFAWAFVNAFHLYRMFTEVRSIDGGTMLLYVLIGYVAPGVVTGLSIGLNPEEFGTQSLCWLNLYKPMIWSLAGPVLFCCVSIEVFLILCIVTNCRRHTTTSAIRKKDIPKFKSAIWISVASLPLTLCTWLFALLTVNTPPTLTRSHDYVFSVFTCMTALFNLLAHVVFSKQGRTELRKRWKSCQGHGRLEESETSDKPVHGVFGEREGGYAFGYGSESSTTSNSRLTSQSSDLMAQIRYGHSSTSSDIPTFSQSGGGRSRRRRRPISDCSSDSETDSEIRTEREKDIELASSHSSDEDDAITPAARHTLPANELPTKPHSTPIGEEETIFAPPPPNFATPSNTFSRRLSVSTDSTDPFQHNADSSYTNLSFNQPTNFLTFTGGPKKVTPPPFLDQSQQHMNPSFVNSPSFPEKLMAGTAQSPTVSDEVLSSIERTSRASSDKTQPTNHNSQALVGQHHVSAAATREDADSIHTQSTTKSTQEEMFIPPPPRLSFHLSVQPSSGSASSSVTKTDAALAAADAAILDDVNNETQV
ncbi:CELSR1 [Bugula neritina]|uniref:CELSR1 n=1 Tax=Bugula neritina TaxID=10212 RepID=A0A7J7IZ70_BUGNE|nr:CELSR1 [Bugula neritina]